MKKERLLELAGVINEATSVEKHPLMHFLMSGTLEDMMDENSDFMKHVTGEKRMEDEELAGMLNSLIRQFNLETVKPLVGK